MSGVLGGCESLEVLRIGLFAWTTAPGYNVTIINSHNTSCFSFPATSAGPIDTTVHLPDEWVGGRIYLSIYWCKLAAGSGNVSLFFQLRPYRDGVVKEVITTQNVNLIVAVPATIDEIEVSTMSLSLADVLPNDVLGLRFYRHGDGAPDTYGGAIAVSGMKLAIA